MVAEAQQGLDWRSEFGRGGTAIGVARARDIVNRRALSVQTVQRMSSYFARHAVDKQAEGFRADEPGFPSAGRIAWALWGGDAGQSWSAEILNSLNGRSEPMIIETRDGEIAGMYPITPRQIAQIDHEEDVVNLFGQYDQGAGADGAHYVAVSPFASDGLVCSSCVYYEGPRACHLVAGDIDPDGICKKWVIPESLVNPEAVAAPAMVADEQPLVADVMEPAPSDVAPLRYALVEAETRRVNGRDVEFRSVTVGPLEVRAAGDGMQFSGYAAVFNSDSEPLPFIEQIAPGAFKRSLSSGREIRMFNNHNTDQVLATTRNGSLMLTEDARGLKVDATLPDTTLGRDLSTLIADGTVHSMSFGFSVPQGGDSWSADGSSRVLREIVLHEVSVVQGFPAYPDTAGATVRTADDVAVSAPGVPVALMRRKLELHAKRV
jgi:HK97 family phage prohead protease